MNNIKNNIFIIGFSISLGHFKLLQASDRIFRYVILDAACSNPSRSCNVKHWKESTLGEQTLFNRCNIDWISIFDNWSYKQLKL